MSESSKIAVPQNSGPQTERDGMQSTQRYRTKEKFSFRSVRLKVTVDHFKENCSYPFRSKG
uniref:Uncharacterized protein n=1 Tax=Romanomermis culicivorax TaxID=13658 RepID=A0A915I240_ROMCU